jgi:hypothetical protein
MIMSNEHHFLSIISHSDFQRKFQSIFRELANWQLPNWQVALRLRLAASGQ